MLLFEQINKDVISAMKEHRKGDKDALALLKGKCQSVAKTAGVEVLEDTEVIRVIQKHIKELEDERDSFAKAGRDETVARLNHEIGLISAYLPKMLTAEEIKEIVRGLNDQSLPAVMKYFKSNYSGKVDMGLVNRTVKGGI